MSITLETQIGFSTPSVKYWLFDQSRDEFSFEPQIPDGFVHETEDRYRGKTPETYTESFLYKVRETFYVTARRNTLGRQSAVLIYSQSVILSVEFWVFFQPDVSEEEKSAVRLLANTYDPETHGEDLEAWARSELEGKIDWENFSVEPCVSLEKNGGRKLIDGSQRKYLLKLYGQNASKVGEHAYVGGSDDLTLAEWSTNRGLDFESIGEELLLEDDPDQKEPKPFIIQPSTITVPVDEQAADPAKAIEIATEIINLLPKVGCEIEKKEAFKILTIPGWPEFKIEWRRVVIKLGCARIVFHVPVLRVRVAFIVMYAYVGLPKAIDRAAYRIATSCALKAALGSAVVGLLTSNISAALGAYVPLVEVCVGAEIAECMINGLFQAVERTPWT